MRHGNSGNGYGTSGSPQTSLDNSLSSSRNSGSQRLSDKTTINTNKQNKHIKGSKEFQPGKSEITISASECQDLVKEYAGTGEMLTNGRERIDFRRVIGYNVDEETGERTPTTIGIVHYSKTGCHIVPAKPKKGK